MAAADGHQLLLRAVQRPGRRQDTGILGGIGVAEHHLLAHTPGLQLGQVGGVGEEARHDLRCGDEVVQGLEEGHHIQAGARRGGGQVDQT